MWFILLEFYTNSSASPRAWTWHHTCGYCGGGQGLGSFRRVGRLTFCQVLIQHPHHCLEISLTHGYLQGQVLSTSSHSTSPSLSWDLPHSWLSTRTSTFYKFSFNIPVTVLRSPSLMVIYKNKYFLQVLIQHPHHCLEISLTHGYLQGQVLSSAHHYKYWNCLICQLKMNWLWVFINLKCLLMLNKLLIYEIIYLT